MKYLVPAALLLISACQTTGSNSDGLSLSKSLPTGFKAHGYQVANQADGHPVRSGESSMRFEVRSGDCSRSIDWNDCENDRERHELKSRTLGGEKWYHWSLYLPEDYQNVYPVKVALGQFHQLYGHVVWMFQNNTGGLSVDNQILGSTLETKKILSAEDMIGNWSDILVHVNWSDGDDGFFRVYVNGQTTPSYAWAGATHSPGKQVFYKLGIYRTYITRYGNKPVPTQVVFYDDVAQASSCAGATSYFNCPAIIANQSSLPTVEDMAIKICDGEICDPTYQRSAEELSERFACWLDYAKSEGKDTLPSPEVLNAFISAISGYEHYLSPRNNIERGMPDAVISAHKADLLRLINWTRPNEGFCDRPSLKVAPS